MRFAICDLRFGAASLLGPSGLRVALYHNVTAAPGPLVEALGISNSPEMFARHLDVLRRDYDVVDLDAVLSGKLPRRPLLVTFDDAYRSVLTEAAPLLKERGLPAVFFVIAGAVGTRCLVLDNLLCYLSGTIGLGRVESAISGEAPTAGSLGELIGGVVARLPYARRIALADELTTQFAVDHGKLLAEHPIYLGEEDMPRLAEYGIEVGNHTGSHIHCRALGDEEAKREIAEASARLAKLSGRPVRAFSYPYGGWIEATPAAQGSADGSGHTASFLVHARTNRRHPKMWYRVGLDGRDARDLFLQLEVLPRMRTIREAMLWPMRRLGLSRQGERTVGC